MAEHIDKVEKYIGRPITRLHPRKPFTYWLLERPVTGRNSRVDENKGKHYRTGNGWPSPIRRWCTREKVAVIQKNVKNSIQYIGIASDEVSRLLTANLSRENNRFPLVEWDMSEDDCLQYCYARGFDWGGLYKVFKRVSCYCCPLQRIGELKALRKHFPELWQQMLDWDSQITDNNIGFRGDTTVHDLEKRFAIEDMQLDMFELMTRN